MWTQRARFSPLDSQQPLGLRNGSFHLIVMQNPPCRLTITSFHTPTHRNIQRAGLGPQQESVPSRLTFSPKTDGVFTDLQDVLHNTAAV